MAAIDKIASNLPAERAVLAGIFRNGAESYFDVADILGPTTFTHVQNQAIFDCIKHIVEKDNDAVVDVPFIHSAAHELGLSHLIENKQQTQHLQAIISYPVNPKNTRGFAAKIRKLEITRLLHAQLGETQGKLEELSGDETITHILGLAEDSIFDFSSLLNDRENEPVTLGKDLVAYTTYLGDNPVEQIGISTGFAAWDQAIGGGLRPSTVNVIGARPKALRYGSKVYTSMGYKLIEDIKVNDMILHPYKGDTRVTEIHNHKNIDIYRMYFRDGDYVDCCKDHLWHVNKRYPYNKSKPQLKTTLELKDDLKIGNKHEYKWDIPLSKPVEFQSQPTELDPYVLGLLIGDGSFRNAITFSTGDNELIVDIKEKLSNYDIKLEIDKPTCKTYRINSLQPVIRQLGLYKHKAKDKFIPKHYIYNSIEVRLAILRGLMDSDGDCTVDKRSKNHRCRFGSISKQLVLDIKEIVQSLGGLCSATKQHSTYKDEPYLSYRCEIRLPLFNPFKLKRKASKYHSRMLGPLKRTVTKIRKLAEKDNARCLTLEHNDGLFLTTNYVVTHNTGKTLLTDNIGYHIAKKVGIPVLNMDTEMKLEDHKHRTLAMMSGVEINDIETGKFSRDEDKKKRLMEAAHELEDEKIPYYHMSIAGSPLEEQLAYMRRWLVKHVGFDDNGQAKPCVVLYDYLKLMSSDSLGDDLKEFQLLGFLMTALHNFAVRYNVPFLALMQLNRDGITKETTDTASGSDRIIWLCSNFTIFKRKSDEEIAEDGIHAGNRKLVPVVSRHGADFDIGNYINCHMEGQFARITEGETKFELKKRAEDQESGFISEDDNDGNDIPFD